MPDVWVSLGALDDAHGSCEVRTLHQAARRSLRISGVYTTDRDMSDEQVKALSSILEGHVHKLATLRSAVTRIEQEMRGHATKSGNAGHRQLTKWADALASLVNEHEAPETSPKPSLGDF